MPITITPQYATVQEGTTLRFTVSGRADRPTDYRVTLAIEGRLVIDEYFEGPRYFEYYGSYTFRNVGAVPTLATLTSLPDMLREEARGEITVVPREVETVSVVINSTAGGTTDPPPGSYTYDRGSTETFTAIPYEGYYFERWVVNGVERTENPLTLTLNEDTTITAYFAPFIPKGTLRVDTEPVKGEVYVEGESWGVAPQERVVDTGMYEVSFGDVEGYVTPSPVNATVSEGRTTEVLGTYVPEEEKPRWAEWFPRLWEFYKKWVLKTTRVRYGGRY